MNTNLCTDDLTVVTLKDGVRTNHCFLLSLEEDAPPPELRRLVGSADKGRQALEVESDANSHHMGRGESLLNFIIQSSLEVENRGIEPTYVLPTSKNILDITGRC